MVYKTLRENTKLLKLAVCTGLLYLLGLSTGSELAHRLLRQRDLGRSATKNGPRGKNRMNVHKSKEMIRKKK